MIRGPDSEDDTVEGMSRTGKKVTRAYSEWSRSPQILPDDMATMNVSDCDNLPEEALVALILSSGFSTKLICTPHHIPELVTGWLFTQGLVSRADDILTLQVCDLNAKVLVQVKPECPSVVGPMQMILTSGCSGGRVLDSSFRIEDSPCRSDMTVTVRSLIQRIGEMYQSAFKDISTGGLHCAAIIEEGNGGRMLVDSDVGRHNAVDKVIGAGLARATAFDQSILVTSGRVSSDMVLKAVRAGIPIIATRRSVTTLAARLAEKAGITVVGRLTRGKPLILGVKSRVIE